MLPVVPIAVRFNVPSRVVVWIALVGSDPIETEAASVFEPNTGPSIVFGKASVLGTNALVFAKASFVRSYLIWNFTKLTKFDPGLTMMSIEIGSPIFFRIGVLVVESGVNERDVEVLAWLRVSCLRFVISNVKGMVIRIMPIRAKVTIFLFIDYINYRI